MNIKQLYISLFVLFMHIMPLPTQAAQTEHEAYTSLSELGFENLQIKKIGNITYVALEDNIYRGVYRGIGIALEALSPSATNNADTIILVAKQNDVPRVTVTAIHSEDQQWHISSVYGEEKAAAKALKGKKRKSSFGKIDLTLQPEIMIDSLLKDNNGKIGLALSPSLNVTLWKGASLTAQVIVPIWDNIDYKRDIPHVLPGVMTLNQMLCANQKIEIEASAGIFRMSGDYTGESRSGIDIKTRFHLNNRIDLGLDLGYTGAVTTTDAKWNFKKWDTFFGLGQINYYEPLINCQFNLQAGQFTYGDTGIRLDVVRRLAEYSVGCYGAYCDKEVGMGIFCSIPFGPKKKMKHTSVRVSLPESLAWNYLIQNDSKKFVKENCGIIYSTTTDGNYSNNYWQPEYITKYVLKFLTEK